MGCFWCAGEAFGMIIPHQAVSASYLVAITYVLIDTYDKVSVSCACHT